MGGARGFPIQQIPRNQKMGWILKQLQWAQSHQFFSAIWKCHLCSILGGEASRMSLWDTSESSFFNVKISNLSNFSVTIYQSLGWMIFSPFLARPIYLWNLNASHLKNVLVDCFGRHHAKDTFKFRSNFLVYPLPSNWGKWRFIGIPYYKCNDPGGDCYWLGGRSKS